MRQGFKILTTSLFFILNSYSYVSAQVVINELSPASNPNGYGDWIELYVYEDVNLLDYYLTHLKSDGNPGNIEIPEPYEYGPNSTNGIFKVISVSNYLGNNGDKIRLYRQGVSEPLDDISYGDQGGVCVSSPEGSIGRLYQIDTEGSNVVDRFLNNTKGASNKDNILDPCPTPTPTPTPTSTNTPTSTKTPTPSPTPKSSPTKAPTPKPTVKAVSTEAPTPVEEEDGESGDKIVLGLRDKLTPTPSPADETEEKGKFPLAAGVLILSGLGFMGAAAYPFFKRVKNRYNIKDEKSKSSKFDG